MKTVLPTWVESKSRESFLVRVFYFLCFGFVFEKSKCSISGRNYKLLSL